MYNDNPLPETSVHEPTVRLITCAYPDGIPNSHYLTLLSILEKNMSIRVLASVIAFIRGGHYAVYMSDVVESMHHVIDEAQLKTVMDKLLACGYEQWLDE